MNATDNVLPIEMQMPNWSREDYATTTPYEWLYQFRDDQYQLNQLYSEMADHAKKLKISNFAAVWRGYLKRMRDIRNATYASGVTAFTGQPLKLECGAYRCNDQGVFVIDKFGEESCIIPHPIMPITRIYNVESEEERMRIAYNNGSGWKMLTVGSGILANATKIILLADKGLEVTSENARELVRFIADIKSKNRDVIPKISATSHLGWQKDGTFSPFGNGIEYDGDNIEYQHIFESIAKPHGDKDEWMRLARNVRSGKSVPARIALAASFAAPLISKMGGLPFIVHLWGNTGCGKTVGLMLAASVWGDPVVGGYPKTFMATKVAIEGLASFCANLPVIYDELQVIGDRQQFDDIIYMLCEGASKGRGTKDGGLQVQKRWNTAIITSGEMPIVQGNSGGGAAVRTIEVNYGGENLFDDGHAAAETLRKNYGFAGREIINALNDPDILMTLNDIREGFRKSLAGEIEDKQVLSASILLTADWLANKVVFNDNLNLQPKDIMPYLVTKREADKQRRCYDWLLGFVAANDARFHDQENGERWGTIENSVLYFNKSIFDDKLQKAGFSSGAFLNWAKMNGVLKCEDYGPDNRRMTVRKTINGTRVKCVALLRNVQDDLEDENGYVRVDDDLPF